MKSSTSSFSYKVFGKDLVNSDFGILKLKRCSEQSNGSLKIVGLEYLNLPDCNVFRALFTLKNL
jgi:hypothetical protein